jgi:hypothetical protein
VKNAFVITQILLILVVIFSSTIHFIRSKNRIINDIAFKRISRSPIIFILIPQIFYVSKDNITLLIFYGIIIVVFLLFNFLYRYYGKFDFYVEGITKSEIITTIYEILAEGQVKFKMVDYDKLNETDFQIENSKGLIEVKSGGKEPITSIRFKSYKIIGIDLISKIRLKVKNSLPEEVVKKNNSESLKSFIIEQLIYVAIIISSIVLNFFWK